MAGLDQIGCLAWIDLETSGTQDESGDVIIEFAMMVTRPDLTPVWAPNTNDIWTYQSVVKFEDAERDRVVNRIRTGDTPVLEMHTANGLLAEIERDEGKPLGLIDQEAAAILKEISKPRKSAMIAGSGVGHFDRRFVRKFMPQVEARLWYPPFDIGIFRRMLQAWGMDTLAQPQGAKTHRALDDIRDHIREAGVYKTFLQDGYARLVDSVYEEIQ